MTKWSEVRRRLDPDGRRRVNAAKRSIDLWEQLHKVRHGFAGESFDDRNGRAARWVSLIDLRQSIRGDYEAPAWERLTRGVMEAIIAGRPVWPVYARFKRGEVQQRPEITIRMPSPTGDPSSTLALRGARVAPSLEQIFGPSYREIEERVKNGELEATPARLEMLADWHRRRGDPE